MRRFMVVMMLALFAVPASGQLEEIGTARERLGDQAGPTRLAAGATLDVGYDDGEADDGRNAVFPHAIEFATRFDAGSPGALTTFNVCLQRLSAADDSTGTYAIRVYNTSSSGPGALIGSFEATSSLPVTGITGSFRQLSLSSPLPVPASFYVGVEMDSLTSDFFLCVDGDGARRPIFGSLNGGPWLDLETIDPDAKKLMVRVRIETSAPPPPPPPPPPGACSEDATTACLLGNRFRATVRFRNGFDGAPADTSANRKPVTGFANPNFETAFFYFNSPDNIEVMLKMLDQGNTNGAGQPTIAVLTGTATPLRVEITITDTQTGASKTYVSPFTSQQGLTDFTAFVR